MAGRWIACPTVAVSKVGHNDDHPGMDWIVIILGQSGLGTVLGAFQAAPDAQFFAQNVANTNGWSLRIAADDQPEDGDQ